MSNTAGNVKTKAIEIIKDYMGDATARMYQDFYQEQEDHAVIASLTELLNEYMGSSKTKEILSQKKLE